MDHPLLGFSSSSSYQQSNLKTPTNRFITMAYLQCGPGYDKRYYGAGNSSATDCYEYKHQESGYMAGGKYGPPAHHQNNYSGGSGYYETDKVSACHSQGSMPGSGYGFNNSAGYYSQGHASQGLGHGTFLGGARTHRSQHTRRRRVRKQYPTGEYYSCSESGSSSESSDDEGRRCRRVC